jgi:hypothetical protein
MNIDRTNCQNFSMLVAKIKRGWFVAGVDTTQRRPSATPEIPKNDGPLTG